MTLEKRCTIEPVDVLALTFECKKCGAAQRIPVAKLEASSVQALARNCAYCLAPSGFVPATSEFYALTAFCTALRDFVGASQGRNLDVRLEVECSAFEAKP